MRFIKKEIIATHLTQPVKFIICLLTVNILFFQSYAQIKTDSVFIEGNYRTFNFYQPKAKSQKQNLVFVLHGSGGDGKGMLSAAANLQAVSEKEGAFLVYPDGYKRYWNECRKEATSEANKININEEAFFSAMLDYFVKNYQVDNKGFFVIGLSGGGHTAYKLAVTMPDKCLGISAIVANLPGTSNFDCAESRQPMAVMITNGTADQLNPHGGGKMIMSGASWGEVRSTDRSFRYWADLAGYTGQPDVQELKDPDPTNGQTITRYTFKEKNKPEVTLLQVNNGTHDFPKDIDVFLESWAFFERELERIK